jgi:(2Fe-2S) ferredoxin
MAKSKMSQVTTFSLEGRFLGYQPEDGRKNKRLQLATAEGECSIKLTKEARAGLSRVLVPGDWVRVSGRKKLDRATQIIKLKADFIEPIVPTATIGAAKPKPAVKKSQETIFVCQKSGCMKRGGQAVCQALEIALSDRGLDDQVTIKRTGCMKNCGKGPNVVMPGKARYCKIGAQEIPDLVDKHFPAIEPVKPAEESRELVPVR